MCLVLVSCNVTSDCLRAYAESLKSKIWSSVSRRKWWGKQQKKLHLQGDKDASSWFLDSETTAALVTCLPVTWQGLLLFQLRTESPARPSPDSQPPHISFCSDPAPVSQSSQRSPRHFTSIAYSSPPRNRWGGYGQHFPAQEPVQLQPTT